MSSSGEVFKLLTDIVIGHTPIENVILVKNVSCDVTDEALTNFLEVVSDNRLDVENIYSFDTAIDLRLVQFTSKFEEDFIKKKISVRVLSKKKVIVTTVESPQGILVKNIPETATEDNLTFYFEKVLKKEHIEVNTQIFKEIGIAVIEVENPERGLPLIFETAPHRVCDVFINVEPYVQAIHDEYIVALWKQRQSTKPAEANIQQNWSYTSPDNIFKNNMEKDLLYTKKLNTGTPFEDKSEQDCQEEITYEEPFFSMTNLYSRLPLDVDQRNDELLIRSEVPNTETPPGGNLRIFVGNSDELVSRDEIHIFDGDSNTSNINKLLINELESGARGSSTDKLSLTQEPLAYDANQHEFVPKKQIPSTESKSQPKKTHGMPLVNFLSGNSVEKWNPKENDNGFMPRGQMSDVSRDASKGQMSDASRDPMSDASRGQMSDVSRGQMSDYITDKIDYSYKKENVMILSLSSLISECPTCNIRLDERKGTVMLKGTKSDVEIAKLKHFEILNSVEQDNCGVSKNVAAVLSTIKSKELIKQKLQDQSVKAYATVANEDQLQVFAFSKNDVKRALNIVKENLSKQSIPYSESHFQFLNGDKWTSLVKDLQMSQNSMVKIEVVRGQKVIIVEGWKREVSKTVTDIQNVLKDNSDYSMSAKLSGGKAKCFNLFLEKKMQDDYARKNNVKIKINKNGDEIEIQVKGNKDDANFVGSQVQQVVNNIWNGQLDFGRISRDDNDQALLSKSLSSKKGTEFLRSFEQQHRCVIEVHQGQRQVSMSNFEFTSNSNGEEEWYTLQRTNSMPDMYDEEDDGSWSDNNSPDTAYNSDSEFSINPEEDFMMDRRRESNREVNSRKYGRTVIRIKQGDITREIATVLVNVVPIPSMRVKDSAIYSAFVNEGGHELEKYFQGSKNSADRNVVYTQSGGKLKCEYVFHLMLTKWQEGVSKQRFQQSLESCFEWCVSLNVKKIAFPAVGVGKYLQYPPDIVANLMISEAKKASKTGKFEEIIFVIYDRSILTTYEKALEGFTAGDNPFSSASGFAKPPLIFPSRPLPQLRDVASAPSIQLNPTKEPNRWAFNTPGTPRTSHTTPKLDFHAKRRHSAHDRKTERPSRHRRNYRPQQQQHRRTFQDDVPTPGKEEVKLVTVELFAESIQHGEKVRSELSKKIKAEFLAVQKIENECIKHLSKDVKKKLFDIDACKHRRVILNLNAEKHSITIKGESTDVSKTESEILKILLSSDFARGRERQPRQRRHQRGTEGYWKELGDSPPTPGYWKHFQEGFSLFDPLRNLFKKPRVEYEDVNRKTFSAILDLIQKTWRSDLVGQGSDAKNLNHKNIKVKKIQRIENYDLYRKYSIKRMEFFQNKHRHYRNVNRYLSLEKIKHSTGPISLNRHMDSYLMSDIFPEINEHYLFHGTTDQYIENILKKGLDSRNSSDQGMLGKGTYAAESSTKADQYADQPHQRINTNRKMLLVRMLLGNIYVATQPKKYSKPPCQCMQDGCFESEHDLFDSVVGDITKPQKKLFREFVVYSLEQCYPEYLITYDRV